MFTKNLSKPLDIYEIFFYEWMHVCMIMLHKRENMVRFKIMMMESMVTTPFGKDYGFHLHL
jgi:hypothetical protein